MTAPDQRSYFFDDGIAFTCTECGQCCSGGPGLVRVDAEEIASLADVLNLSIEAFSVSYLRELDAGTCLKEQENDDCIFLEEGTCQVYRARPKQCRTFPFWVQNLRNEANWAKTCQRCPGIGEGRLYKKAEILAILEKQ